jgi:hypothetical protein
MNELKQNIRGESRSFVLAEGGVEVEIETEDSYSKFFLRYENLDSGEYLRSYGSAIEKPFLIISLVVNVLLVLMLVFGLPPIMANGPYAFIMGAVSLAAVVGIVAIVKVVWEDSLSKPYKYLNSSPKISFLYYEKEKKKVDEFIAEMRTAQRNYLRETYMKIHRYRDPDEQKDMFLWLHEQKFITESELEILMEEIKRRNIIDGY